jgi:hypothetical protein
VNTKSILMTIDYDSPQLPHEGPELLNSILTVTGEQLRLPPTRPRATKTTAVVFTSGPVRFVELCDCQLSLVIAQHHTTLGLNPLPINIKLQSTK